MRDMIVFQDHICAASHNNTVFCFCQITDEIAHIKKYCILFWKAVITVKLPESGFQASAAFFRIFVKINKVFRVIDCILICLQALHNLVKDFHVIVIDLKIVRQFKTDIISGTSLSTADADHKMVIF